MNQSIQPIDYAGYGTIRAIREIAKQQLIVLAEQASQGAFTAFAAFANATDGMTRAIETIEPTPLWGDTRTQALAFVRDYAQWLAQIPSRDRATIDTGMAEILESLTILNIAVVRLGQRLDLDGG